MRTRRLIRPAMQLRLTLWFVCLAIVSLGLQFLLFASAMTDVALEMPGDAGANYDRFSEVYQEVLLLSLAIVLPLTVVTGVVATFRIAGPIYRITSFLQAVRRGERPADCRVRAGDELHDVCDLVNEVTAPLRRPEGETAGPAAGHELEAA
jgi:nitrogen fixation/metabolism regulation signal transduction histidine kinase